MGAAGGIGTCSTRSGRSRRSDRTVGTPAPPRQVASAGAGAVLSPPAARCRRPRVGRAGAGSRRHRRPRGRRHLPRRHQLVSPRAVGRCASALSLDLPSSLVAAPSPPATVRPAHAGTRHAARSRAPRHTPPPLPPWLPPAPCPSPAGPPATVPSPAPHSLSRAHLLTRSAPFAQVARSGCSRTRGGAAVKRRAVLTLSPRPASHSASRSSPRPSPGAPALALTLTPALSPNPAPTLPLDPNPDPNPSLSAREHLLHHRFRGPPGA